MPEPPKERKIPKAFSRLESKINLAVDKAASEDYESILGAKQIAKEASSVAGVYENKASEAVGVLKGAQKHLKFMSTMIAIAKLFRVFSALGIILGILFNFLCRRLRWGESWPFLLLLLFFPISIIVISLGREDISGIKSRYEDELKKIRSDIDREVQELDTSHIFQT